MSAQLPLQYGNDRYSNIPLQYVNDTYSNIPLQYVNDTYSNIPLQYVNYEPTNHRPYALHFCCLYSAGPCVITGISLSVCLSACVSVCQCVCLSVSRCAMWSSDHAALLALLWRMLRLLVLGHVSILKYPELVSDFTLRSTHTHTRTSHTPSLSLPPCSCF
mgnify:CR=1 FL=1